MVRARRTLPITVAVAAAALAAITATGRPDLARPASTVAAPTPVTLAATSTTASTTTTSTISPTTTAPVPPATEATAPLPPALPAPVPHAEPAPPPPAPAPAPATPVPAEASPGSTAAPDQAARALRLLNSWRQQNGLPPLAVASDAQSRAQAHAEQMAAARQLSHTNLQSAMGSWSRAAENVGYASSADIVQQMFQDSASHNRNMLAPDMTHVGVGAAWGSDGNVYICQEFVG